MQVAGEFVWRIVGTRQERKGVVNIDQRDHAARIRPVPVAPKEPPIGAPDQIEKRLLPKSLRPFLRLRQESDEFARSNVALDLPANTDSGLIGVDAQEQGKAIEAPIPLKHVQFLFGGCRFQVREETAISQIGRRVETPGAGKIARRGLSIREPSVEPVQAPRRSRIRFQPRRPDAPSSGR